MAYQYKINVRDVNDTTPVPPNTSFIPVNMLGSGGGGSGGGVMIAHGSVDESAGTVTLDKTWQEIADAVLCFIISGDAETTISVDFITEIGHDSDRYSIGTAQYTFYAESPNDYPAYDQ